MSDFDIKGMLFSFDQWSDAYLHEEVEEALLHQEELTPHLIRIIETVGDNPLLYALEQRNAHVYAAALLAHFGETAAHLPLIRAFSIPEEQLLEIWGDITTITLPLFLYRTCGGSLEAIRELVLNRAADQYARCAAMETLAFAVALQPSLRDEVIRFFQGLFTGEEAEADSVFWASLAATLCDLHPGESMEILRQAREAGLILDYFISWEDIEEANARNPETAMTRLYHMVVARIPTDAHGYISWLAEFNQEEEPLPRRPGKQRKKKPKRVKPKAAKKPKKKKRK